MIIQSKKQIRKNYIQFKTNEKDIMMNKHMSDQNVIDVKGF
ncbi:hypothetical protein pb186bvf_009404 [Paramecium bursaria]